MANAETVGQRFTQLIQAVGLSKNAFALSLDKTATVIQHIVEERNKPGFDLLCKVFDVYPNVSKDWLLQGVGQMYNDVQPPQQSQAPPADIVAPEAKPVVPVPPALPHLRTAEKPVPALPLEEQDSSNLTPSVPVLPAESVPAAAPGPTVQVPAAPAVPVAAPAPNWEAALYAQQLQHQLALAELRNQHLQEQQKMLQQMVELLRQPR